MSEQETSCQERIDPVIKGIADELVAHVKAGQPEAPLWDKHFCPDCVSVEGDGTAAEGRAAMDAKCEWFYNAMTMHSLEVMGPFYGATGFSVHYKIDMEAKDGSMPRSVMHEVGVYTVKDGKVVREEFMSGGMC